MPLQTPRSMPGKGGIGVRGAACGRLSVKILFSLPGRDIIAAVVDSIVVVDLNIIETFERW